MSMDGATEMVQAGYRYALSLTHHHYDAEDLVQQAWAKCHHRYGKVRNRSMLYTTIRNLFYDHCRRNKIITFEALDDHAEPAGESSLPVCDDLDILLAGLRAEEREALYLNVVEGYSAREIGEQTDAPRNTILSLIHRAKTKIADAMAGEKRRSDSGTERK